MGSEEEWLEVPPRERPSRKSMMIYQMGHTSPVLPSTPELTSTNSWTT